MLVKQLIYTIILLTLFFSCVSKNGKIDSKYSDYNGLYNLVVNELGIYIKDCSEKNDYDIKSIIVADSLYTITEVDTSEVSDKNHVNLKLISIDSLGFTLNNDYIEDDFYDSNYLMLNYQWNRPSIDEKDFDQLEFTKKVNINRGGKNIFVSFSPPFQQDDKVLVLAKVYSEKVFFTDEFFVFIEIERNSRFQFQI